MPFEKPFIDVNDLLSNFDLEHHRNVANQYFAKIGIDHPVMRKPFHSPTDCVFIIPGIQAAIDALQLFYGARILDFGCGAGWLTRILAQLGCDAYGIDIAVSAVNLARKASSLTPNISNTHFTEFDGSTINFANDFFDGVVCFDSFHHVHNQKEILAEMFRVTRAGGRVVFHEPGPNHSRQHESQMEMRAFGVIERDMVIEELSVMATDLGFEAPKVGYLMMRPLWTDVAQFNEMLSAPAARPSAREIHLGQTLRAHANPLFENIRIFYLQKPGVIEYDSRQPQGLHCSVVVMSSERADNRARGRLQITNTGTATWLPSGESTGAVNIGVQLVSADGAVVDRDFHRLKLSDKPFQPGHAAEIVFEIEVPSEHKVRLDLVAEHVGWFERFTGVSIPLF